MVRIRKKTSKRGKTHQREKIKRKVTETHKKAKKEAKKNPQWKSKKKKDPGIPNNFPYKDQILAEVAEERRKAAEEKQLRKEQKKLLKTSAQDTEEEPEESNVNAGDFDGIKGLSGKIASSSKGKQKAIEEEIEAEDAPILINRDFANLSAVLEKADVVVEMLDARDPFAYHSSRLVTYAKENKKALLLALNKIDLCPREALQSWTTQLRQQHPAYLFRSASAHIPAYDFRTTSASDKSAIKSYEDAVGAQAILNALEAEAKKLSKETLTVAIVGLANSGKSSFLNSIMRKYVSPIYKLSSTISGPSTTERPLEITFESNGITLCFIDTPALSWIPSETNQTSSEDFRPRDVLVRSRGRLDKAKDPISVVKPLISRANAEDLMLFYNLPAFSKGDDTAFLSALARANNLVKKAGELDLVQASRIVLRDWSTDSFPRYTVPTTSPSKPADNHDDASHDLYKDDAVTLEAASTRKELRKGRGLIRLLPLDVEARELALNETWDDEGSSGKSGDDDDEEALDGGEEADEDNSGSEDEDVEVELSDDSEEESSPLPRSSLKRKAVPKPAPRKRVAFDVKSKPAKASQPSKISSKISTKKKARK